jgi:hypothetical protein
MAAQSSIQGPVEKRLAMQSWTGFGAVAAAIERVLPRG